MAHVSGAELLHLDFHRFNVSNPEVGGEIEGYITALESYKKIADEEKDYALAQKVYEKLVGLKNFNEARKRNLIESEFQMQRKLIEDDCAQEVQKFNIAWDQAMSEYDAKTHELVEGMKVRHQQEFLDFQKDLRIRMPLRPKFSSDILNMRRVQNSLAKQNNFAEAHRIQKAADDLEANELVKLTSAWELKLQRQEDLFQAKQESELLALVKRVQTGQEEQNKVRKTEYDRLLQRYVNLKIELDKTHTKNRKALGLGDLGKSLESPLLSARSQNRGNLSARK